jgi:ribosomal protein S1
MLVTKESSSYKIGTRVMARVEQVLSFGIFARLPDGSVMYVRRRELTLAGDVAPEEVVFEGQDIEAVVVALPAAGRNLEGSMRQAIPDPWEGFARSHAVRDSVRGRVKALTAHGVFVEVTPGVDGYMPLRELAPWPVEEPEALLWLDDDVEAMITHIDGAQHRLRLSIRQQLAHLLRVQQITGQLRAEVSAQVEPQAEATGPAPEDEAPIPEADLSALPPTAWASCPPLCRPCTGTRTASFLSTST